MVDLGVRTGRCFRDSRTESATETWAQASARPGRGTLIVSLKSSRERPADMDGYRILVDRIWPRGISKKALALDEWVREIAPTTELRKWFGHDHSKWQEFKHRYFRELDERPNAIARLVETVRRQPTTLVFGARDVDRNNAVAPKEYLERNAARQD